MKHTLFATLTLTLFSLISSASEPPKQWIQLYTAAENRSMEMQMMQQSGRDMAALQAANKKKVTDALEALVKSGKLSKVTITFPNFPKPAKGSEKFYAEIATISKLYGQVVGKEMLGMGMELFLSLNGKDPSSVKNLSVTVRLPKADMERYLAAVQTLAQKPNITKVAP